MSKKSMSPWRREGVFSWRREPEAQWDEPFAALQRSINQMFSEFGRGLDLGKGNLSLAPSIDFSEDEETYRVTAELPGVRQEDVSVTLRNGNLVLAGEKKEEKEERKRDYYRSERYFGSFNRVLPLPGEVEQDKVQATFKDGVLSVTLPKSREAKEAHKKIAVKAG